MKIGRDVRVERLAVYYGDGREKQISDRHFGNGAVRTDIEACRDKDRKYKVRRLGVKLICPNSSNLGSHVFTGVDTSGGGKGPLQAETVIPAWVAWRVNLQTPPLSRYPVERAPSAAGGR